MSRKAKRIISTHSNLVGTIHSPGGFAEAKKAFLDVVEVRADILPQFPSAKVLAGIPHPVILTVRRKDEGGGRLLTDAERLAVYLDLLPSVAAVDLEARSLRALRRVTEAAHAKEQTVVVSYHDFHKTPALKKLTEVALRARDGGADIVKFATFLKGPADAARLLEMLEKVPGPLAVMGMGPLGRASRLLFAKAGSVLNYGWLGEPFVAGQWSAREFRDIFDRA